MAYSYEQILAVDPSNPANVARAASITIFAPGDAAKTPLTITDTNGAALPNPLTSNANGFAPAFIHATLDRVAWEGGGLTGFLTSYEGMKEEAVDARTAAESAAANAAAAQASAEAAAVAPTDEAIDAGIARADLSGKIADVVSTDPTVAAQAASLAQSDAGLARAGDPGIAKQADLSVNIDDAIALDVDLQNFVSRAILPDGTQYFPRLRVDSLTGAAAGKIKGRNIICRGDSITAGALGNGVSYPVELSKLVPGVPVFKRGWPGEKTAAIAKRQGSLPLMITVTGGTLAASTAAQAVTVNDTIFIGADAAQGVPEGLGLAGSINGVSGRLTGNSTSGFFFTRNSAGGAIAVPEPVPWVDEWETSHRDSNQIIWTGRNNVNIGFDDVVPFTQTIIDYQTAGDFLVLAVLTRSDETSGTAGYIKVTGWNNQFATLYSANYFDIRRYLIDNGLAAAGLTPTTEDNAAIAGDTIPPQLLADGLHPTAACYKVIASAVKTKITEMGWV